MEEIVAPLTDSQNPGSGTLNVLLHGAFTLIPGDKQILALMPTLEDHVYRAGSWLAETELRSATYRLEGVKEGTTCKFDRDKNLFVKFNGKQPDSSTLYASFVFPLAKSIKSLRVLEVDTQFFSRADDLCVKGDNQHMTGLQVLSYDIADENKLGLRAEKGEDHHWQPAFAGGYLNLHIISSEDHYHKPSNAHLDLAKCVELLGSNLKLKTRFLPASGIEACSVPPPGVAPEEMEDLALRTLRMARLGRLVVQHGDANQAWHGNDALDGNPKTCRFAVACPKHECECEE
jgi:hypothetical protein